MGENEQTYIDGLDANRHSNWRNNPTDVGNHSLLRYGTNRHSIVSGAI